MVGWSPWGLLKTRSNMPSVASQPLRRITTSLLLVMPSISLHAHHQSCIHSFNQQINYFFVHHFSVELGESHEHVSHAESPSAMLCHFHVMSGSHSLLTSCRLLCLPLEYTPKLSEHLHACSTPILTCAFAHFTAACDRFHCQTSSAAQF